MFLKLLLFLNKELIIKPDELYSQKYELKQYMKMVN